MPSDVDHFTMRVGRSSSCQSEKCPPVGPEKLDKAHVISNRLPSYRPRPSRVLPRRFPRMGGWHQSFAAESTAGFPTAVPRKSHC